MSLPISRPPLPSYKPIESLSNLPLHPYLRAPARSAVAFGHFFSNHNWIVPTGVWMHARQHRKRASLESGLDALVQCFLLCFLLLLLQMAGLSFLQIGVNIRPKLLQFVSQCV